MVFKPLFSGVIAYHLSWRWVFYVQAISCGALALASAFLFEETRENVLLSRAARALNTWHEKCEKLGMTGLVGEPNNSHHHFGKDIQQVRWRVAGEEARRSPIELLRISLSRPFCKSTISQVSYKVLTFASDLLLTEPVVFWFSLWIAFAWGVLYLSFAGIPIIFADAYRFDSEQTGAVFIGEHRHDLILKALVDMVSLA